MELLQSLRYAKTRRYTGRRSLTPMRSKHKTIGKTRGHRVEKKRNVQLFHYTNSQYDGEREGTDKNKHSPGAQGEGDQNSDSQGKREDTEINEEAEQIRNTEDSKESVHPGPLQTLSHVLESTADYEKQDKEGIEAEELAPLP